MKTNLFSTVFLLTVLLFLSQLDVSLTKRSTLKKEKCEECNKTTKSSFISIPLVKNTMDLQTKKKFFDFLSESHSYLVSKSVDSLVETRNERSMLRHKKSHTSDKKSIRLYNFKNTQVIFFVFYENSLIFLNSIQGKFQWVTLITPLT